MSGIMNLLLGAVPQVVPDPYFEYTTLLLPGNGTNGAQNNTFLDSSTNNFTITRNGNTTQGTFSPFSQTGWGNYFDGTGDYLTVGTSTAFSFGTSDFTIEFWTYKTSSANGVIVDGRVAATATPWSIAINGSAFPLFYDGATEHTSSIAVTLNAWNHVAIARSSGTLKIFVNGVQGFSSTVTTNLDRTAGLVIGARAAVFDNLYLGYLSNLRIVKGTAVYTSAFTPPTTPLTAITNTSLLTCQSNRFIDNSTNAFAITRNGDVSVQAFSPFNPTAAWSASTNGGSGYFDGSGDYLTIARNTAFIPTTGDFTVEAWVYVSSLQDSIICGLQETGVAADWSFALFNDGRITLFIGSTVTSYFSTATYKVNQWNHIMACRSGSTLYLGVNGAANSTTATGSLDNSRTYPLAIGSDQNGDESVFSGFISGLRFIKGSAAYASTTYTVPTAPPTAITNTSLLLNYTNAGIYDATSKNDLETVGNAQISTTQSKFGGSSMLFDGTGDYLKFLSTANVQFGSGDFTVEAWIYPSTLASTYYAIAGQRTGDTTATIGWALYINASKANFDFSNGTSSFTAANSTTLLTNTWQHIAVTKSGNSVTVYVNGSGGTAATVSGANSVPGSLVYVGFFSGSIISDFNGYIQDLRITKGYARYTSTFTPPTAAFPLL